MSACEKVRNTDPSAVKVKFFADVSEIDQVQEAAKQTSGSGCSSGLCQAISSNW